MIAIAIGALLLAGCARSPKAREASFLARGTKQMEQRQFERAILEFRNAAKVMPKDAEPLYRLALVYVETRDRDSAIKLLRKATDLNPKHTAAQLKLAMLLAGSPNPNFAKDAKERVEAVISQQPNNMEALDVRATMELRLGQFDAAAADLEKAIEKSPENVKSAIKLAQVKVLQKDLGGAEGMLKQAAGNPPKSVTGLLALARFYLNLGRKPEAREEVERARRLDGRNASTLIFLAALQADEGRNELAEKTYHEIAALPGGQFLASHALFLYRLGRRDEAIRELEKLHQANLENRRLRGLLVVAYGEQGRVADAARVLNAALKRNPKDTEALLQRGQVFVRQGRTQEAITDLSAVLRLSPNSAIAHFELGTAHQMRGGALIARQEFEQASRLDPGLLPARMAYARMLLSGKDASGALGVLDKAPTGQHTNADYVVARNWALLSAGRTKELRTGIDQGLALARTPDLLYQDALLRSVEKDTKGATTTLEELLSRYPESTPAVDLLASISAKGDDRSKALGVVREYAARTPKSAALQNLLGLWLLKTGQRPEARSAFLAAAAADPDYARPQLILVQLDVEDGALDQARARVLGVLARNPQEAEAAFLLGLVEDKSGNADVAIEQYRKAVQLQPGHLFALNNLAYALAVREPDEALKYAQMALELAPGNPVVNDTMGWVYFRKGIYRSAVKHLSEAVSAEASPQRQFHLGMAYAKLGERDRARLTIDAAVKLDPKLPLSERGWMEK